MSPLTEQQRTDLSYSIEIATKTLSRLQAQKDEITTLIESYSKQAKDLKRRIAEYVADLAKKQTQLDEDTAYRVHASFELSEGIEVLREKVRWGTLGLAGKGPVAYVLLKHITSDHISNILRTQHHISDKMCRVLAMEAAYRLTHGLR